MDWFATALLNWFDQHGRHDLPWQHNRSAYRVWVSEVMLQQTQVGTVIPYFERFMARFPTLTALADAPLDAVLHHWTGLGYYARARNLHRAAQITRDEHDGELPDQADALCALPGIGRSTAGAIAAIAYGRHEAILDGNVKRVLARVHAVDGYPGLPRVSEQLWGLARQHTPATRTADYTQAIMDLGATQCVRRAPDCNRCPIYERCRARIEGRIETLPAPRPRRSLPERRAKLFLLLDRSGRCLLEQRAASGIWGGLWSPPERAVDVELEVLLAELGLIGSTVLSVSSREPFRHTFTHFHLHIEPVEVRIEPSPVAHDRRDLRWVEPRRPDAVGLSAPALRLLSELAASQTQTLEPPSP